MRINLRRLSQQSNQKMGLVKRSSVARQQRPERTAPQTPIWNVTDRVVYVIENQIRIIIEFRGTLHKLWVPVKRIKLVDRG